MRFHAVATTSSFLPAQPKLERVVAIDHTLSPLNPLTFPMSQHLYVVSSDLSMIDGRKNDGLDSLEVAGN